MRFSLYLGLLVYIGTVLPLYAQDIIALQERLMAKKEDYQIQAAKLREANQKVTHLTGEVRVAQAAVENATKTMEQAWEQLSSKFQLLRLHPTISIEEERLCTPMSRSISSCRGRWRTRAARRPVVSWGA